MATRPRALPFPPPLPVFAASRYGQRDPGLQGSKQVLGLGSRPIIPPQGARNPEQQGGRKR